MKSFVLLSLNILFLAYVSKSQIIIENFNGTSLGTWTYYGQNNYLNTTASINGITSTITGIDGNYCGAWYKDGGNAYDYITYTLTTPLSSDIVDSLKSGKLHLNLSIVTPSTVTNTVFIKIQNQVSSITGGTLEYTSTIAGTTNWQNLSFLEPVTTSGNVALDQILIFFQFGKSVGSENLFHFYNLQIVNPLKTLQTGLVPTTTSSTATGIIENPDAQSRFKVYPNPSKGVVTVEIPSATGMSPSVTVCTIQGLEVAKIENQGSLSGFIGKFDVSAFNAGLYLLKIDDGNGNHQTRKLVISE